MHKNTPKINENPQIQNPPVFLSGNVLVVFGNPVIDNTLTRLVKGSL